MSESVLISGMIMLAMWIFDKSKAPRIIFTSLWLILTLSFWASVGWQ